MAAALVRGERVLLGHRTAERSWYPSVWDLPGGHVEPGESETGALLRDLNEEVGVRVPRPVTKPIARLRPPTKHEPNFELAIWLVTDWSGEVTNCAPAEHDELRWCSANELLALSLAHPQYRTVLARAIVKPPEQRTVTSRPARASDGLALVAVGYQPLHSTYEVGLFVTQEGRAHQLVQVCVM
ncbi:MAG: NUDIX domain-containing protein [Candidatus Dormiibacterota bacterium]